MVVTTKKNSDEPSEDAEAIAEETVEVVLSKDEPPVSEGVVDEGDVAEGEDIEAAEEAADAEVDEYADADVPVGGDLDWVGGEPAGTSRGLKGWLLVGGLAVLVTALLISTGVLGWLQWQSYHLNKEREELNRAAASYALVLTSIDSNNINENFDAVLDGATGEFKDMYSESSEKLRQLLVDNKASAHGQVVESAVQSVGDGEGVVLLFIDQAVSNTNVPDPRLDRSRMKMTMKYVDGRWRASKVELP
ncbi:YfgM family protein [Mycolicibacterium fallax]|uniref:Uncharacterized protein n=1 Tax=Mycolicibacterium fallax TaxID=1793 RepID=A0A1X1RDX3_MYCFA|nr:hypothetical protein AWC04_09820 [Mycolicibacterium fallax]BBY99399.1 hypothetical protein MFAL_28660 [Mycolicibacterium fallax]